MKRLFAGGLVVLSGAFAMAACVVDESFPEGQFRCDPKGGSDECPPGLVCTPAGVCRHSALTPNDGGGEACFPLDCTALEPYCGYQLDGCGGPLYCECSKPGDTCSGNPLKLGECGCSKQQLFYRPPDAEYQFTSGVAWKDLDNVEFKDAKVATTTTEMAAGQTSAVLNVSVFKFNMPVGVTITGIQVDIDRSSTSTDSALTDKQVRLYSGTTMYPDVKTDAAAWTKTEKRATYGGKADLWGASAITVGEVAGTDFGVSLSVSASAADTPNIDLIQITIYFDNPACTTG